MFFKGVKAEEYSDLPVRHNEDELNKELSYDLPIKDKKFNFKFNDFRN